MIAKVVLPNANFHLYRALSVWLQQIVAEEKNVFLATAGAKDILNAMTLRRQNANRRNANLALLMIIALIFLQLLIAHLGHVWLA